MLYQITAQRVFVLHDSGDVRDDDDDNDDDDQNDDNSTWWWIQLWRVSCLDLIDLTGIISPISNIPMHTEYRIHGIQFRNKSALFCKSMQWSWFWNWIFNPSSSIKFLKVNIVSVWRISWTSLHSSCLTLLSGRKWTFNWVRQYTATQTKMRHCAVRKQCNGWLMRLLHWTLSQKNVLHFQRAVHCGRCSAWPSQAKGGWWPYWLRAHEG